MTPASQASPASPRSVTSPQPVYVIRDASEPTLPCFEVELWNPTPDPARDPLLVATSIEEARAALPPGLRRFDRTELSDSEIVEVWL